MKSILAANSSPRMPPLSPTIFQKDGFRFFFFSREESRPHVHVRHAQGEAKFWLEPDVALAAASRLNHRHVAEAKRIIEEHRNAIRQAWRDHFGS